MRATVNERCAIHPDRAAELTCKRCGSFACYECVGPADAEICARCRIKVGGTRVGQIRILAILTIVNGSLLTLFGGMYALCTPVFAFMPTPPGQDAEFNRTFMPVLMACFGLVNLAPGVLQIIAGVRMLKLRGRAFALIALGSGLMTICGIYCAVTSIGVGVYGFLLLFDPEVRAAFDRDEGR